MGKKVQTGETVVRHTCPGAGGQDRTGQDRAGQAQRYLGGQGSSEAGICLVSERRLRLTEI